MKKYIYPEIIIENFENENVLAASSINDTMNEKTGGNFKSVTLEDLYDIKFTI